VFSVLFVRGVCFTENDLAKLLVLSADDGRTVHIISLETPLVWDGMAAADGRLYVSATDGHILCLGADQE
jgi:hypothetical protein